MFVNVTPKQFDDLRKLALELESGPARTRPGAHILTAMLEILEFANEFQGGDFDASRAKLGDNTELRVTIKI